MGLVTALSTGKKITRKYWFINFINCTYQLTADRALLAQMFSQSISLVLIKDKIRVCIQLQPPNMGEIKFSHNMAKAKLDNSSRDNFSELVTQKASLVQGITHNSTQVTMTERPQDVLVIIRTIMYDTWYLIFVIFLHGHYFLLKFSPHNSE